MKDYINIADSFWKSVPNRPTPKITMGSLIFWASLINILLFPFWRWLFIISTPFDVDFIAAFNNSERNRFHIGAGLIVLTTLTIFFCLIFQLGKRFFPRFTEIIADILVLGSLLIAANYMRTSYIQILSIKLGSDTYRSFPDSHLPGRSVDAAQFDAQSSKLALIFLKKSEC